MIDQIGHEADPTVDELVADLRRIVSEAIVWTPPPFIGDAPNVVLFPGHLARAPRERRS